MPSYTKLFGSIIASTIWLEPDHTRLVWITMLALADKNGEVHASIPGLAKLAGVPLESCRAALASLLSPDPDSRTKTSEGRRVVEIDGGWELINHAKYRELASTADAIESNRIRQARFRERNAKVTESNGAVTPSNKNGLKADTTPDADADAEPTTCAPAARKRDEAFEEFWQAYPRRVGKAPAESAWKKHRCSPLLPQILVAVRACKISADWTKDGGQFIPHPATWLNRRGWEDELLPRGNGMHPGIQENLQPKNVIRH